MGELLTIVDQNRNPIGVKLRDEVHRDGDWHETFQCWFIERIENSFYIYLQKRSADKKDFPLMFDITVAGHLAVNETAEDGVREIKEELGIDLSIDEITFLEAIPNSIIRPGFIDNEISLVYLYEVNDKHKCEFQFVDQEVESIIRIPLKNFELLMKEDVDYITGQIYLEETNTFVDFANPILKTQIVPHSKGYYQRVFKKINDYTKRKEDFG